MSRSDRGGYVPQAPITTIWKMRPSTVFLGAYQHNPPLPFGHLPLKGGDWVRGISPSMPKPNAAYYLRIASNLPSQVIFNLSKVPQILARLPVV